MPVMNQTIAPLRVKLVGDHEDQDFAEAVELLRTGAQLVSAAGQPPELIVVAQSRPGTISERTIESLRRDAPLAGVVGLLGTWCEGETRTGKPWPGVERLYWYEFPPWWQRQLSLRAAGGCPDWARPADFASRISYFTTTRRLGRTPPSALRKPAGGLIVLATAARDTAIALGDVLREAGYATVWRQPSRLMPLVRGALAGIWDGAQLSEREERDLAAFSASLAADAAPIIALLDFPRRDRVQRAHELGAAAVLAKPWLNVDILETVDRLIEHRMDGELTTHAA
jgi:hypothetical protein